MNKLALVTGGTKGIGRSIVKMLSRKGYLIAFTYCNSSDEAYKLEKQLIKENKNVKSFYLDQSNIKSIEDLFINVKKYYKTDISILINNAGISQEKEFELISVKDWDQMLQTNLRGPFFLIKKVLENMNKNKWGKIVNISSIGGQWGGFNQVHYAASKSGLINLTKSVSNIYAKNGINCNCIAVGLVDTDMIANEIQTKKGKEKIKNIPINRIGSTEDVADLVKYLISDESSYISGQTINLNGGMYYG